MAITDKKISTIYNGRDISSLSDRPNQDGMTATELKARFDQLGKEIIPKINDLIDELFADFYSGSEQTGHTHNIDNLVDGITYKLFTAVERAKLGAIAEGAEVNQNAFSNVKVGSTTIASSVKTDTFELVAGLNVSIAVDTLTKKITLSATGDLATEAVQSYIEDIGNYFTSLNVEGALQEIGAKLSPSSSKATPIDADTILLSDSVDSNIFKKLTWANIKATLKAYFDTIYQAILVSGTNIKTVNSTSLLGSGDLAVQEVLVSGTNIKTINSTSLLGSGDVTVQPTLVSGTNIKTINGNELLGSGNLQLEEIIIVALSDEVTALTTGTAKSTFRMPYACKLTSTLPRININTVSSSGLVTVDVNKNGTSIFSTLLTIDVGEKTSVTAVTPCALSATPTTFTDDQEITCDIDVSGTDAKGLKLTLFVERV